MGLSIHYSGNFKQGASLNEMIVEVKDLAESYHWKYHIFKKEFPDNSLGKSDYENELYGICFSPPECEPIFLCFLSNGMLSSPIDIQFNSVYAENPNSEYLGLISTKTQFAGIEIHKKIILLLDYLSNKYLENFTLSDEGQFWETRDESLLKEIFKRYETLLDLFALGLENIQKNKGESIEDFIERVASQLGNNNKEL
jgi:hypothetical protein